jgi:splicing factor 45
VGELAVSDRRGSGALTAKSVSHPTVMRKMGYLAGQGLGVDGSGIKHALSAEHTNPVVSKKGSGWTQAKTAQGKLVNLNENERAKADKERFGEPSRIVCLRNVVGSPAEVDDDLPGEMADECNNYGCGFIIGSSSNAARRTKPPRSYSVVERVLIHHVMPPPPNPVDAIRIFIVFSGLAGAWRCVKELDGRFFAGHEVVSGSIAVQPGPKRAPCSQAPLCGLSAARYVL